METQSKKKKPDKRSTMTIKKDEYIYTLIEGKDRDLTSHPSPSFMGKRNWALKACKKIVR
jgi:hypothetical protein